MKSTLRVTTAALVFLISPILTAAETPFDPNLWSGAPGPFSAQWPENHHPAILLESEVPAPSEGLPVQIPVFEAADDDPIVAIPSRSASATLAALVPGARANAFIQLEPIKPASPVSSQPDALEIDSLWNTGQHDRALLALEQLEAEGVRFVSAISWEEPVLSGQKLWYADVRIGGSRTGATDVILDFDRQNGTIFAAVSWADSWTLNISTDGGATWSESFEYGSSAKIGMAVAGNYAWVAYSLADASNELRMRRFDASTGAVDGSYFYETITDIAPDTVAEVELGANADDFDNRVFPSCITTGNEFQFYWTNLDGTTFTEMSPPVINAEAGLDFSWSTLDQSSYTAYVSYVNNVDNLIVWGVDVLGDWDPVKATAFTGLHVRTQISAHSGTVMVGFEELYAEGNGIGYTVSYNNGADWLTGRIYEPESGEQSGWSPSLSLRGGIGSAATYNSETGDFDEAYVTNRSGYGSGPWSDPLVFNNFDLVSGSMTEIEWIGVSCVNTYGMVYMGEDYIPYFDLFSSRGFFCDGFESGATSAWD